MDTVAQIYRKYDRRGYRLRHSGPQHSLCYDRPRRQSPRFQRRRRATLDIDLDFAESTGAGYRRSIDSRASYADNNTQHAVGTSGVAPPDTVSRSIDGIQIFDGGTKSVLRSGLCWLRSNQ